LKQIKFLPFYLIAILPFPVLYLLSDFAYLLFYYLVRYRRKVVAENLKSAFPHLSAAERITIEKKFYKHFCDLTFETFKTLTISKREIKKRFRLQQTELLERFYKERRSVILYTAHDGNWEWLVFLPVLISHTAVALYKPLSNKYYDALIHKIRSRFGVLCIESDRGYKTLYRMQQEHIISANYIIGDQRPGPGAQPYFTMFLNRETGFLTGAERIAKKTNQPLVFPSYKKLRRGYYEIEFILIEEFPQQTTEMEITEKFARTLETKIRNNPEMWLWSHKRWKHNSAQ